MKNGGEEWQPKETRVPDNPLDNALAFYTALTGKTNELIERVGYDDARLTFDAIQNAMIREHKDPFKLLVGLAGMTAIINIIVQRTRAIHPDVANDAALASLGVIMEASEMSRETQRLREQRRARREHRDDETPEAGG